MTETKDNRYKDADGTLTNPECGNSVGRPCSPNEVRWFPTGWDSNDIMCEACAKHHDYDWGKGYIDIDGSKGPRADNKTA